MSSIDRLLIDPDAEALDVALRAAVAAVDHDLIGQGYTLDCDPDASWRQLSRRMQSNPEGAAEWRVPGPGPNGVRAALLAVWWSDFLGRRHLRLLGGCAHRGMELPLPLPSPHRPALTCVYPEACVIATQHRRPRLLCVCECGAWGPPQQLAWMGATCGPCADRAESEPLPRLSVLAAPGVRSLLYHPDGRLAVWDTAGRVTLLSDRPGEADEVCTVQRPPGKLAFAPDGAAVGCLRGGSRRLEIREPGGGQVTETASAFTFCPTPGQVVFQRAERGALLRCELSFPDEGWLADGWLSLRGGQRFRLPFPVDCQDLAISPDGRLLAAAAGDQGVCFWDAYSGEPRDRAGERRCDGPLLWSPDGTALACGVDSRFWKAILWDVHGRRRRAVIGGTDPLHAMAFTPDGQWLLTAEGSVRAWDVASGQERQCVTPCKDFAVALAVSPDGRTVALGTAGGRVRLWPVELLLPQP